MLISPLEVLRLSLGPDRDIARMLGLSRGQIVSRWERIPTKHIPALERLSAEFGRFRLTAEMLVHGARLHVSSPNAAADQMKARAAPAAPLAAE